MQKKKFALYCYFFKVKSIFSHFRDRTDQDIQSEECLIEELKNKYSFFLLIAYVKACLQLSNHFTLQSSSF